MFVLQAVSYFTLTVNYRAIGNAQYLIAGGTAAFAAFNAYVIVRRVVRNEQGWGIAGLMTGGAIADMAGIWATRHWQ